MKQKLPNQLTMARIFMIPIFVILFYLPQELILMVLFPKITAQ